MHKNTLKLSATLNLQHLKFYGVCFLTLLVLILQPIINTEDSQVFATLPCETTPEQDVLVANRATFVTSYDPGRVNGWDNSRFIAVGTYTDYTPQPPDLDYTVTDSQAYLAFPSIDYLQNAQILCASIELWHYGTTFGHNPQIDFRLILNPWADGINWNNTQPGLSTVYTSGSVPFYNGDPPLYNGYPIVSRLFELPTQMVEDMFTLPWYGIAITSPNPADPGMVFCSGSPTDGFCQAQHAPRLTIRYDPNVPPTAPIYIAPADDSFVSALDTELSWNASTDADGDDITYDVFLSIAGDNNFQAVATGLTGTTFDIAPAFVTPRTAYEWYVVAEDEFGSRTQGPTWTFDVLSLFCSSVTEVPSFECVGLEAIFEQMDGTSWEDNAGWMVTNTPCASNWNGIICNEAGDHVIGIALNENNVSGTLPDEIGYFTELMNINFGNTLTVGSSNNQLIGNLPDTFGDLTQLEMVNFRATGLSGSFPLAELVTLTNLREIRLGLNNFTGTLDNSIGSLTQLQIFRIANNNLTGEIPSAFGQLVNLDVIDLSNNVFDGNIPTSFGSLSKLTALRLQGNRLSGSVPSELCILYLLKELNLSRNALGGDLPSCLTTLLNLISVDVQLNAFTITDTTVEQWLTQYDSLEHWRKQTVASQNLIVESMTVDSVTLGWDDIAFTQLDPNIGYFEVFCSSDPYANSSQYEACGVTNNLAQTTLFISNIDTSVPIYFWVRTYTGEHGYSPDLQQNAIYSLYSNRITQAPPDVPQITLEGTDYFTMYPIVPTVSFPNDPKASSFWVFVEGNILGQAYDRNDSAMSCTIQTCTINVDLGALENGIYDLTVYAYSPNPYVLYSDPSNTVSFEVDVPIPTQPINLRTEGSLADSPVLPTYLWDSDPNDRTLWYQVVLNSPNGTVFNTWFEASQICNDTTCSITPEIELTINGDYLWWVGGWNHIAQVWSDDAGAPFIVAIPLPVVPANPIVTGDLTHPPVLPMYSWDVDPNALWYQVVLNGGVSGTIFNTWHEASDICDANTCTINPPNELTNDAYTWWIGGWNPSGQTWNTGASFDVQIPLPVVATNPAVTGSLTQPPVLPTYSWDVDPNVLWYQVALSGAVSGSIFNTWHEASDICDANTCTINPPNELTNDSYTWWIGGWNPSGQTWNTGVSFDVQIPLPAVPMNITTSGVYNQPTYSWDRDVNVPWYQVVLNNSAGISVFNTWHDVSLICTQSTCSITPVNVLPEGTYTLWIGGWNPIGQTWNTGEAISITAP